ncbi:PfkB family carbohydrate kinase [Chryseobacterium culicis]|uniref:PfkB family carbohydrate kinase n=1 Tax=Chryseobacterium culicis TaxID=680127 RepID=UPI00289E0111|nr:PfkB family carbohydrate kinase [Chryseobacterium culicis]
MEHKKNKAVCFGEVLWDIFPGEQKRIGGAPFNVAYHLSRMGIEVDMISRIGDD